VKGETNTVAVLLEYKANLHANNDYALICAARQGQTDTVAVLLKYKANIHAEDDLALKSANLGHKETVALLLEQKASWGPGPIIMDDIMYRNLAILTTGSTPLIF
jgi:hypothetical protein